MKDFNLKSFNLKRYVFIFLTVVIIIQLNTGSYAKSVNELKKEQSGIQNSSKEAQTNLEGTRQEKSEALAMVDAIDIDLNIATEELEIITAQLEETKEVMNIASLAMEYAEDSKKSQYETLVERVKYMYINGNIGYLDTVLKANSFSDFLNRVEYMNRIAKYDQEIFDQYKNTEDVIAQNLEVITAKKIEIAYLQDEQIKKTEWLQRMLDQKNDLVYKLSQDEIKYQQQLDDLDRADKEIENLIIEAQKEEERRAAEAARKAAEAAAASAAAAAAQKQNIPYTGGKLGVPLSSYRFTSGYGNRTSPISGKSEFHTGIDMAVPQGTNVYAAESGVVTFSGTINGYGYVIVIDHGNRLSTMYAHNSVLLVSKGQSVKRGDVICKSGNTGYSTGPHLHFEVRIDGKHTNPLNYIS